MKKLSFILIFISAIYFITWGIWGKSKLFEMEYNFLKKQEYYVNDDKKIYLLILDYNYFDGYGFYDSLNVTNYTNKIVETRMIDDDSNKSYIVFKVGFYNPFFIKSTKSYWVYGTDGVFDFSTNYSWFFFKWIQLSDTKYE